MATTDQELVRVEKSLRRRFVWIKFLYGLVIFPLPADIVLGNPLLGWDHTRPDYTLVLLAAGMLVVGVALRIRVTRNELLDWPLFVLLHLFFGFVGYHFWFNFSAYLFARAFVGWH
jgi:hypothetical protein